MAEHELKVLTSTSGLTPDGILGYAKGIATSVSAILIAVVEFLPDGDYKRWTQIAIAVLGAITTIAVPNKVKPEQVVIPPVTPAEPEPILGVVLPPEPGHDD